MKLTMRRLWDGDFLLLNIEDQEVKDWNNGKGIILDEKMAYIIFRYESIADWQPFEIKTLYYSVLGIDEKVKDIDIEMIKKGNSLWNGKRLLDMTKEELIDALYELGQLQKKQYEQHLRDWDRLLEDTR